MLKPKAVNLRINLWKIYFQENKETEIPKFGLNFLQNQMKNDKRFLLICGFENFDNFYIRVDILERLFLKTIESTKNGKFKIDSDMINLIGCNKENFFKLLESMEYKRKIIKGNDEEFFVYQPKYKRRKERKTSKKTEKSGPFDKLSELRFR